MAKCINMLFISSEDIYKLIKLVGRIKEQFDCYYISDLVQEDFGYEESYEIEFLSEITFPEDEMNQLTANCTDYTLYIIVISYDISSEYLGYHIYKEGEWKTLTDHPIFLPSSTGIPGARISDNMPYHY